MPTLTPTLSLSEGEGVLPIPSPPEGEGVVPIPSPPEGERDRVRGRFGLRTRARE